MHLFTKLPNLKYKFSKNNLKDFFIFKNMENHSEVKIHEKKEEIFNSILNDEQVY